MLKKKKLYSEKSFLLQLWSILFMFSLYDLRPVIFENQKLVDWLTMTLVRRCRKGKLQMFTRESVLLTEHTCERVWEMLKNLKHGILGI